MFYLGQSLGPSFLVHIETIQVPELSIDLPDVLSRGSCKEGGGKTCT